MIKKIKVTEKKRLDKQKEADEWKNKYLRALADYQNLEKRVASQTTQQRNEFRRNLISRLLDVLDNIERAEAFVNDSGLKLVKDQFLQILKDEGVTEMEVVNKPFDPNLSECVELVPGKHDNIVRDVISKGYTLDDEVLRVARVKVSKKDLQVTSN